MFNIETVGAALSLLIAAGAGSVAGYFWRKITHRLDAGTLEGRSQFLKQFRELDIAEKDELKTNVDRLETTYFHAIYLEGIREIVRQVHKASHRWYVFLEYVFVWALGVFGLLALSILVAIFPNRAEPVAAIFTLVIAGICIATCADRSNRHHASIAGLTSSLLGAKSSTEIQKIIQKALAGEGFYIKEKRSGDRVKKYYPLNINLAEQTHNSD